MDHETRLHLFIVTVVTAMARMGDDYSRPLTDFEREYMAVAFEDGDDCEAVALDLMTDLWLDDAADTARGF